MESLFVFKILINLFSFFYFHNKLLFSCECYELIIISLTLVSYECYELFLIFKMNKKVTKLTILQRHSVQHLSVRIYIERGTWQSIGCSKYDWQLA